MATIVSTYYWNKSVAKDDEWDSDRGGFLCANADNDGITFSLSSGTALATNASSITSATWTAKVETGSGIARSKYYFNNFAIYKNGAWQDAKGSTTISSWTVASSSGTGTVERSDGFRVNDGKIGTPSLFKGLGGEELRCRISIGNSTSERTLLTEATLTITWEEQIISYTKPTVALNSVETNYAPNKSIEVSWKGTDGSNNTISKYEYIYKTTQETPSSSTTGTSVQTKTQTSITTPNTTAGTTTSKYFYVKPYGTNSDYNGSWTGPLTVSSYYTNISWNKTFKIGGLTGTIYVGNNGTPKGTLYWDPVSTGVNNNVSSQNFYKDNSVISSYDKNSYNLTTGSYKVIVTPEIGDSLTSNIVTIENLKDLTDPSFSSTIKTVIDKNFTFKINSLDKSNFSGVKSITQTVERIYNGVSKTISLTNNEGTCDVSDISDNSTFTLKITATYNDNFGGYTNTIYTSAEITKVKKIEIPEGFIQYIGEENDLTSIGTDSKFFMTNFYVRYNNLNKGLTSIKYKYEMYYQIGNDAYILNPIVSSTNTSDTYGKFIFNSILDHASKLISFYIKVTDNTTGSYAETEVFTIYSLKAPIIDSVTANVTDNKNEIVNFTINYKSSMEASAGDMKLSVNFIYNGVKGRNNDYTYNLTPEEQFVAYPSKDTDDYYYSCIANNENIQNFYSSLLQEIYPSSGAGIYNPNLQLWIKIEYVNHPSCFVETTKSFDNWPFYLQENPVFSSTFSIQNPETFYNPLDIITLSRGNLDLSKKRDDDTILTTVRPSEIKYILNYKNSNITFTNNEIEISAPETVQDDVIQIGFISEIKYKKRDGTIITKQYNSIGGTSMEYLRFNLAKWNSNIVPYLSNCSQSNGKIEGKINFESDKIYSKKYYNLDTIEYEVYKKDDNTIKASGTIKISSLTVPSSETFSFDYTEETNVDIYAKITYTNTSNKSFTAETLSYIVRTENIVPLALRKKGIAINVEPTFDLTSRGSSIFASAVSDDVAIFELQANSEATNPKFIHFLNGSTSVGNIYYNESTSKVYCDNWYYPVISVNEKTGIITLTASDVNARSSSWMPTAGSGISISGETITNSGIRTLTATTGDDNGQIKLTINGTATNVSVKGFSTNYLPLSGGTLTGALTLQRTTSIANNYYAGINFKLIQSDNNITTTSPYIRVYDDHDANTYGTNMVLNSGGNMIIGGGESAGTCYSTDLLDNTGENLYLTADGSIYFYPACNSYANHKTCYLDTTGQFYSEGIRGNAIRYSSTEPTTNLAVGQIWLKPKS